MLDGVELLALLPIHFLILFELSRQLAPEGDVEAKSEIDHQDTCVVDVGRTHAREAAHLIVVDCELLFELDENILVERELLEEDHHLLEVDERLSFSVLALP